MRIAAAVLVLVIGTTGLLLALSHTPEHATRSQDVASFTGTTMGTTYSVKVADLPAGIDRERIADEIQAQLDRVNSLMSTYDPESELSQFNASDSIEWFPVSIETAQVVSEAIHVGEVSRGALDVTVGPIVDLGISARWHDRRAFFQQVMNSQRP